MPYRDPRRRISCSSVAVSLAPVHPSGWPSAMAPPLTLSRAGSIGKLAQAGDRLRGERFVELDEVDLIERQAGHLQDLSDRRHRTDAEALGFDTSGRKRDEPCERRNAERSARDRRTSRRPLRRRRSSATSCRP